MTSALTRGLIVGLFMSWKENKQLFNPYAPILLFILATRLVALFDFLQNMRTKEAIKKCLVRVLKWMATQIRGTPQRIAQLINSVGDYHLIWYEARQWPPVYKHDAEWIQYKAQKHQNWNQKSCIWRSCNILSTIQLWRWLTYRNEPLIPTITNSNGKDIWWWWWWWWCP